MEEEVIEREPMTQEEFEKYLNDTRGLKTFEAISKFKSVNRAIKRGHVTNIGMIAPDKPFNNRGNTSKRTGIHSRVTNELKKQIYGRYLEHLENVGLQQ